MANFIGTARSNFVRVKDVDAAIAELEPFGNEIHRHPKEADAIMISGNDDDGTISTSILDDDGEDKYLDWSDWCTKYLKDGQILVLMSAGAEKLRYIRASAEAYNSEGEYVFVNLSSAIDAEIRTRFGTGNYASPEYQEVL